MVGIGELLSSVTVGILFTVTDPAWRFVSATALSAAGTTVLACERIGVRA